MKTISDIGIASLSNGCTKLKKLVCIGLYQLADPRLLIPTINTHTDTSSGSVIGLAALSKHCHDIEYLDLSGCFRLNIAVQKYLSCLKKLKSLFLSNCPLSPSSIIGLSKGCPCITELNLSDCRKGVNGSAMKTLAANCPLIRHLNLGQ